MTITLKAPAKINLHLDVTGRLPNGYHTIRSIMQQVSLVDEITVERVTCAPEERIIRITCNHPQIPTDHTNIVHKCATSFFKTFGISAYHIAIHIQKQIPHGAGLAGGSTDGAAVLKALPRLFAIPAEPEELCRIGSRVGADIPFCIVGGCCLCEGIGEILTPMTRRFDAPVLIAMAGDGVSTPKAYAKIDAMLGDQFGQDHEKAFPWLLSDKCPTKLYNIFESVILPQHPEASALKERMKKLGATATLMSGSGPSVFGLFETEEARDGAFLALQKDGIQAFPCALIS